MDKIELLKTKLTDKITDIDRRLKKYEKDVLIDHSGDRDRLHSEARGYERVLKMIEDLSDPIPPTIKRGDKVNHHLYDEGTVKVYDLYGDGRALVEFDDPECGERLVERNKLEVIPNE